VRLRKFGRLILAGLAAVIAARPAHADFVFTKIADTNTPIPGGTGNFGEFVDGFSIGPALSDGKVAFVASTPFVITQIGVYTANIGGAVGVVADTNTPIPGGTGNFTGFGFAAIKHGNLAMGTSGPNGYQAIISDIGGHLNVVADTNTPIPGGMGNFTNFNQSYSFDGSNSAFRGFGSSGHVGIYNDIGGHLNVVADTNTPIPGGTGNFTGFGFFTQISNGITVFNGLGSSGQNGLYTAIGGHLSVVADTNTPIPGGKGNFTNFGGFSFDGVSLAFYGAGSSGQAGDYTNLGGKLRVVADTHTPIPGGTGNFQGFGPLIGPSISGDNIAISAVSSSGLVGLYLENNGSLTKVIDGNDRLDGELFSAYSPYISPTAVDGNQVGFEISFSDITPFHEGIFVATLVVPEPSSLVLFCLGTLGLLGYSWGRREWTR
jgi:hypothetical protein